MGLKLSIIERLKGSESCDADCKAETLTRGAKEWAALSVFRIR
jgi:hypothetical protein